MAVPSPPVIYVLAPDNGKLVVGYLVPVDGGSPITAYQYSVNSGPAVNVDVTSNPFEITGLTNGASYSVRVRAVNAEGPSNWSVPLSAAPTSTVFYTISRTSANVARIAFSASQMPTSIDAVDSLNFATTTGYTQATYSPTGSTVPFPWTYDFTGLQQANGIRWVVGSFLLDDSTYFVVARQVAAAVPTTPQSVTVTPGNQKLTVSFLPPVSDGGAPITSYSIALSIGGSQVGIYGAVTSPYTISGLLNGTTYGVQVVAYNSVGGTASSSVPGTPVAPTVPSAPTINSVTAGNETLSVAYTASSSDGGEPITGYEYSLDEGATYVSVGMVNPFSITGLTNGVLYPVQLRARNSIGPSSWSAAVSAMPKTMPYAFAKGDRFVRVEFDSAVSAPLHRSTTGLKDALNPRTWNVERLAPTGAVAYTVMSVLQVSPRIYDVLTLEAFDRVNASPMRVYTATDGLELENASLLTVDITFAGAIAAADANPNTKASAKGLVVKDLANASITTIDSLLGGDYAEFIGSTLIINSAGDYASVSGEAMVRKLIMRRLLSKKGDFFHLPNYGTALDIKSTFAAANLRAMAKEVEMQVLQEPEIEQAKATLTYQVANSILVIQVQARMRNTGQQTGMTLSLPLRGTTQY